MNEIEIKEELTHIFSNDPIKWGKWILVFVVFIITFVIRIKFKIDAKFDPRDKFDKKVKKAIENKHIINALLVSQYVNSEKNRCGGKYEYEINGKKYEYRARFLGDYPKRVLHLYYDENPQKVYTNEEYHAYTLKSIPLIILNVSPFIIAGFMVWILGLVN